MRLSTPWSLGSPIWSTIVSKASFPGMNGTCLPPQHAIPPLIHRFDHIVLLEGVPIALPAISDWLPPAKNERHWVAKVAAAVGEVFGQQAEPVAALEWKHRPWEVSSPSWGIQVTIEQAWEALGVTFGEPVGAVSLAPGEELEVQVFAWHRTRRTADLETLEIVDQQVSAQVTTHDSYQVARRIQREFHWQVEGSMGKNVGSSVAKSWSLGGNVGGSVSSTVEKQVQHTRDVTRRVAEQIRSERRVRVSTMEEIGREERTRRRVANKNSCHATTFHFYEYLHPFRVRHAPAEITYVVLAPNPLPDLTPAWVTCHEQSLRDALIDGSMADGFDAARSLAGGLGDSQIANAARGLLGNLRPRLAPPTPPKKAKKSGGGWKSFLPVVGAAIDLVESAVTELSKGAAQLLKAAGASPDEGDAAVDALAALGPNPDFDSVLGFFRALASSPSPIGLATGIILIGRYYAGEAVPGDLQQPLGFAVGVLASLGSGSGSGANAEQDLSFKGDGGAAIDELRRVRSAFERLRCHLEDNLLHYMRAIWVAEDPAARFARFARQTIAGQAFWSLADNQLVGFHLNASVFPVRLGRDLEEKITDLLVADELMAVPELPTPVGIAQYVADSGLAAPALRAGLTSRVESLSRERARQATSEILQEVIERAQEIRDERGHSDEDGFDGAEAVLKRAPAELERLRREGLLRAEERTLANHLETALLSMEKAKPSAAVVQDHLRGLVTAGRALTRVPVTEDLIVTLPGNGVQIVPLAGNCSGCSETLARDVEARVGALEAERRIRDAEADRHRQRIAHGDLSADPAAALPVSVVINRDPLP
ncbi:MAG: hypothetical protein IT370_09120 [Deltaproteobacteria bacterium]|nr:hypothetical protein [Deltaproteobacteria bacterium]